MTGLRALYVQPTFTTRINELNQDESRSVLDYLFRVQHENHENHVKYKWNKHDLAIWDNRLLLHAPCKAPGYIQCAHYFRFRFTRGHTQASWA